jgi:putative transposase
MWGLKNVRLPSYDYQQDGYYFVTIIANWKKPLFKNKQKQIETIIRDACAKLVGVSIDTIIIMPNHVHAIIQLEKSALTLGQIVRRIKARVSHDLGVAAWQPNYYEHVIRNDQALGMIREYVKHNAELEVLKIDKKYEHGTR